MKREDIEKAAKKTVAKDNLWSTVETDIAEVFFTKGAGWRIKSVWHDAKEAPTKPIAILAMRSDGSCEKYFFSTKLRWRSFVKSCGIVRWAYIEDLIPNTDE